MEKALKKLCKSIVKALTSMEKHDYHDDHADHDDHDDHDDHSGFVLGLVAGIK